MGRTSLRTSNPRVAEPLVFCRKVLQNVSYSKNQLNKGSAERNQAQLFGPCKVFLHVLVNFRMTPVRFGSVTVWGWNGSSGSGFRFWRFLCKKSFSVFQYSLTGKNGSGSGFGSWKTVPAVPFRFRFREKRFRRFRFPVPVRFLSHPEI